MAAAKTLYHLAPLADWQAARASGVPFKPRTYDQARASRSSCTSARARACCSALRRAPVQACMRAPPTLDVPHAVRFAAQQDGFTHLTADPDSLMPIANHFYKGTRLRPQCRMWPRPHAHPAARLGAGHLRFAPSRTRALLGHCYLTDTPGEFVLISLDPNKLGSEVRMEPAAPVGDAAAHDASGALFPHLVRSHTPLACARERS